MAENQEIEFDLLENGLDFVDSAINLIISNAGESAYKYSILHLSAGVELVLKERLRQEHWSFIFDNIDKAKQQQLISGDFQSVKLEACINRLSELCSIDLSIGDRATLFELKKRRNKIEHFAFNDSELAIKSLATKVLNFLFDFIHNELSNESFSEIVEGQIEGIRSKAIEFKEFVAHRFEQISAGLGELKKQDFTLVLRCPYCDQNALVLDQDKIATDGLIKCHLCLSEDGTESVAFDYVQNVLGIYQYETIRGGEFPLHNCPECGMSSLVQSEEETICFNCVDSYSNDSVAECSSCGQLYFPGEDDISICKDCWDYRVGQWSKD